MNENKMKKEFLKVLAVCLVFFAFFFAMGYSTYLQHGHFNDKSDYFFHYYRAQGKCFTEFYDQSVCDSYPLGLKLISLPFGFSEPAFYAFMLFLICILIPLLLFKIAKTAWIAWFYFATINFVYSTLYMAIFAQAAILILFLLFYIYRKNIWVSLALIFAGFFFHRSGFIFIIFAFLLYWALKFFPKKLFGAYLMPPINFTKYDFGYLKDVFTNFVLLGMSFPLIIFAFMNFIKRKKTYLLLLSLASFVGVIFSPRVILFSEILLLLGFTNYFAAANKKMKVCLLLFSFLTLFANLFYWFVFLGL